MKQKQSIEFLGGGSYGSFSGMVSFPIYHCMEERRRARDAGDSPMTSIATCGCLVGIASQ